MWSYSQVYFSNVTFLVFFFFVSLFNFSHWILFISNELCGERFVVQHECLVLYANHFFPFSLTKWRVMEPSLFRFTFEFL